MKALVATKETQGTRNNDFSWTQEGELVVFGAECDRESVDGRCGCRRAMSGLTTLKATTTVKVTDFPGLTLETLAEQIKRHLIKDWGLEEPTVASIAHEAAAALCRRVNRFEVGDVLERRGNKLVCRLTSPQARGPGQGGQNC